MVRREDLSGTDTLLAAVGHDRAGLRRDLGMATLDTLPSQTRRATVGPVLAPEELNEPARVAQRYALYR